jgi:5-methylcytosine-specific restriction endonuclease McrA
MGKRGPKPNPNPQPTWHCTICGEPGGYRQKPRTLRHRRCIDAERRASLFSAWQSGELVVSQGEGHLRRLKTWARSYLLESAGFRCQECGWDRVNPHTGKCPLEIDHINGDPYDDRVENFRVLCPNCHSLKSTYKGANRGRGRISGGVANAGLVPDF